MNGFGLAGLARGMSAGIDTGLKLSQIRDKGRERRALREAGAEAKQARSAAAQGLMADNQVNYSPEGPARPGSSWEIGGQQFSDRDKAMKAAEQEAGDPMDFYAKVAVPKITDFYIQNGDPQKAQAWQEWTEQREQKKGFQEWTDAYRAGQMGNYEKVADYIFDQYKDDDDGITPISKRTIKDKDGTVTGFEVKLKNDESGEEYTQTFAPDDLMEMGMSNYAPPQQFEKAYAQRQAALEARQEAAKDALKFNRDVALSDRKFGQTMERDRLNDERDMDRAVTLQQMKQAMGGDAKANAKIRKLREFGYSEEFIRETMPAILGIGQYKKKASPDEVARMLHQDLIKSDPWIDGKGYSSMSPDEQKAVIRDQMRMLTDIASETNGPSPAPRGLDGSAGGAPDPGLFWTPGQ